jgi:hypothetical protein
MRSLLLCASAAIAILAPLGGRAEAVVPEAAIVPAAGDATFTLEGAVEPGSATVVATADGARLVACGAAVVAAGRGSRARISCAEGAQLRLEDGAFRITAGSKGVRILVGGAAITASSARLEVARVGERWLARRAPGDEGGAVSLEPATPEQAPGAALAALGVGAADAAAFAGTVTGTAPKGGPRAALAPRPVERPVSANAVASGATSATADVEVESIEVEVGCIEVCVD